MLEDDSYYFETTNDGYKLTNKDNETILIKNKYGMNFISENNGETWTHLLIAKECSTCHGTGIIYE